MDDVHNDDSNLQKETKSILLSTSYNFLALLFFGLYEAVFQYLIASNAFHYSCRNSRREILAEFWPKQSLRNQSQST